MPHGWEGNRMSGIALAMHLGLCGPSTCGLNGCIKGDEHPTYAPDGPGTLYFFYFYAILRIVLLNV